MTEKIDACMRILLEKKRFTLAEAEEIAKQICGDNTASYVAIEAISRIAAKRKPEIIIR